MKWEIKEKIGVIGSGQIGPDIAQFFSKALGAQGVKVIVVDIIEEALQKGRAKIEKTLESGIKRGAISKEVKDKILENITFTLDYQMLDGASLVIEAATEDLNLKRRIFEKLEDICPSSSILTSNTSGVKAADIFKTMKNPSRTLITHFFYPAWQCPIVEIVPSPDTDPDLMKFITKFFESIGKVPIQVKDVPCFAADDPFCSYVNEAYWILEEKIATIKEIDAIAKKALGTGGPFLVMNLTGGNPLTKHCIELMHQEYQSPYFKLPQVLFSQLETKMPWEVAKKGEKVEFSEDLYQKVSERLLGALIFRSCFVVENKISSFADLNLIFELALGFRQGIFTMMNQMGLKKALEIINKYKEVRPGVQVPSILKQKIEEGKDKWEFRRYVLYEKEDEIAIITIRRPQVLGALSSVVMKELDQVFTIAKEDSSVKGLIITGFGPKAFVSGADISELASLPDPETCVSFAQKGQEIFQRLEDLGKPTVAAINGLALGGGLELALACNKRFIAKGAILGQPEVNLGIIPGYGGTQRLPRWIGFNEAWQMLRSGKPISAEYAEKIGLGTLVEPKELLPQAKKYLKEVIQGKIELNKINRSSYKVPETLPEVDIGHLSKKIDEILKKVILEGAKLPLKEAIAKEAEGFGECKKTKDMEIGMKNFMEKGPKVKANFVHK